MQQCANCQYFVPAGYLSCPQCAMPLSAGVSTPNTVYTGKAGNAGKNPTTIVIGIVVALVAIVAVSFVVRGGDDPKIDESDSLVAPVNDGWSNFTPADRSFTIQFPGEPEHDQSAIGSLNEVGQRYSMKDGDFEFGVVVSNAPAYIAPHEAGSKLAQLMRPIYEGQGATIEAAAQLITPRGNQAYDLVVVNGGARSWFRFTTWSGNLIRIYATLPTDKQPTAAQSQTYSRLRDSIRQA
jgi:hypothetical protein